MQRKPQINDDLIQAFPMRVQGDARVAISVLPENPHWFNCFGLIVDAERVSIPRRIYHNASLIRTNQLGSLERELIHCILTRHCDGFVRQRYLSQIIDSNHAWIPPFVVQLLGEYVIEIIRVIDENLRNIDTSLYAQFLQSNQSFFALTEKRVISYWDCYDRSVQKDECPGFRVLRFFKDIANKTS